MRAGVRKLLFIVKLFLLMPALQRVYFTAVHSATGHWSGVTIHNTHTHRCKTGELVGHCVYIHFCIWWTRIIFTSLILKLEHFIIGIAKIKINVHGSH